MASIGLTVSGPNTEERAVFTQLKPVRMSSADGGEDSSVFEDVKPTVRLTGTGPGNPATPKQVPLNTCKAA